MEDSAIISLFFNRSETAIKELSRKYAGHLRWIAYNILYNQEDSEECENDTYLKTWNTIPPVNPESLKAYVSRIIRNLAIDKYRARKMKKRDGEIDNLYSELIESLPGKEEMPGDTDEVLISHINIFLSEIDVQTRVLFVRRYFYMESVNSLALRFDLSASAVSTRLNRTRSKLKAYLEKQEVSI